MFVLRDKVQGLLRSYEFNEQIRNFVLKNIDVYVRCTGMEKSDHDFRYPTFNDYFLQFTHTTHVMLRLPDLLD